MRNPGAVRPWQFVLDAMSGYLMLARACYQSGSSFSGAWNFGPLPEDVRTVKDVVTAIGTQWGNSARWQVMEPQIKAPAEQAILLLDSSKAQRHLHWWPRTPFSAALANTVEWYAAQLSGSDARSMRELTSRQIERHLGE
jgi:CDP-glucose 4,6-dehydratase